MLMSYLWQVAAPGLAMSLAICGSAGLLVFGTARLAQAHRLLESPVQRFVLASVVVLALLLNGNMWLPGRGLFLSFVAFGVVGLALAAWRGRRDPLSHVILWTTAVGWVCSGILVGIWDLAFAGRDFWILEGTNHDLVFFYGGAKWAMQHALGVDQATVHAAWDLGHCGQGMQFIGSGCVIQRNGAYTLLALPSIFLPDAGPNLVRAMTGASAIFPLLGLIPSLAGRFGTGNWWPRGGGVSMLLVLLCMGCTGMLLSVVNENIGTAVATTLLAMVVLWSLTPMPSLSAKWIMLGGAAGCVGLVYGEAAVHACAIVVIAVATTARAQRSWRSFLAGGTLSLLAFALVVNRELPDLLRSYVQVNSIVAASEWPSWFMHQSSLWWLGAPFAGLLMTAQPPVNQEAVLLGVLLMAVTACFAVKEGRWRYFCGLLLLSAVLVSYIHFNHYQYGEHKILQVLGPAWVALLAWLVARHARRRHSLPVVLCVIGMLAILSIAYAQRARPIILSHQPSALTHVLGDALRLPQPGDEVVIDAVSVSGPERYIKQDFAIIELHQRGARAFLPESDHAPVAYSDALFEGSLKAARAPDWLLVLRQPGAEPALRPSMEPVIEDSTFALYSLDGGAVPVVIAGRGWHQCELEHCWTSGEFTVEAVVPDMCQRAQLRVSLAPFHAPAGARLGIEVNGVTRAGADAAADGDLVVSLGAGSSVITFRPEWKVQSPYALGQSADNRPLAASIDAASVQCGPLDTSR